MEVFTTSGEIKKLRRKLISENQKMGLVPTMGALHEGHDALIYSSLGKSDYTLVSIFVNPTQFNNPEDLEKYPRNLDVDLERLRKLGAHGVFIPENDHIYYETPIFTIDIGKMGDVLEGEFRPGHFKGVALIVMKLFNIIYPDISFFGQKDLQQLQIIKKLVSQFSYDITICEVNTVRDPGGLALSSRNQRLSQNGIEKARKINIGLQKGIEYIRKRESRELILRSLMEFYINHNLDIEYLELVDPNEMEIITDDFRNTKNKVAICIAAYVENVRLIDNMLVKLV